MVRIFFIEIRVAFCNLIGGRNIYRCGVHNAVEDMYVTSLYLSLSLCA